MRLFLCDISGYCGSNSGDLYLQGCDVIWLIRSQCSRGTCCLCLEDRSL